MEINKLKEYIHKENKIEFILNNLGCHSIKYHHHKNYFSCGNPDGDNKTAVVVQNNQYLNCQNYTRNIGNNADIITLIQFYKKIDFKEAVRYLHNIFGFEFTYSNKQEPKKTEKSDPLYIFKKVLKRRTRLNVLDLDYEVLNDNWGNDFVPYPHISFAREGIIKKTIDKFKLAYSYKYRRTIIPIRHWYTGEVLGYNARSSIDNCEELGIIKYYTSVGYPKGINLYGLFENYDEIMKCKYVTVHEGEKSTLKRHSRNDPSGVSLSGKNMTHEQVRILCGLGVEIVISLDKGVDINESRHIANMFYGIRKVSYIYDKYDLLKDKESPADAPNKIYEYLFKHRIVFDEKERKEYLKSLDSEVKSK